MRLQNRLNYMADAHNEANAGVIASQIQAFGGGTNFARYELYQKLAPRIQSILAGDEENGLGGLFRPFLAPSKDQTKETHP